MNLIDRNAELDKARELKAQIAESEAQLNEWDDDEGQLKDELAAAREELAPLLKARTRDGRVGLLLERIGKLENRLYLSRENAQHHREHVAQTRQRLRGLRVTRLLVVEAMADRPSA